MGRLDPCLEGSLADLSIQDVLQILLLGGKTGYLSVESRSGTGAVVFQRGRVVAAIYDDDGGPPPAVGASVSQDARDALIRERITAFLYWLTRSRRGRFSFMASTESPLVIQGRQVAAEALDPGIDVIELLVEIASRISGAGGDRARTGDETLVLLVDDEELVRRLLSRYLVEGGYRVVEAGDVESAVTRGKRLAAAGSRFVLVTDLNMPAPSGNSFRGGIEVVKRLARLRLRPPVVMMADTESWSLPARTMQKVSSVVLKPGPSNQDPEGFEANMRALAGRMVQEVLPRACGTFPA